MKELTKKQKDKISKKLLLMAEKLENLFPNAKTELEYSNDFQLLIAILMSAQSTDKQVNKVNKVFFEKIKKPEDAIELGIENIKKYISSISFFNNKATNIYKTSVILAEKGSIPETLEELQELPGVGVKTAKVFLGVTKNAPYLGVDTHVHRVLNRFGVVETKTPLETDKIISKIPLDYSYSNLHNTLILFGRYYSKAGDNDFSKSIDPEFCKELKKSLDSIK